LVSKENQTSCKSLIFTKLPAPSSAQTSPKYTADESALWMRRLERLCKRAIPEKTFSSVSLTTWRLLHPEKHWGSQ
jgi:hypothetical protein